MSEKTGIKNCEGCSEQDKCIPYFDHQNTMMHYNWANRRMLIAPLAVCLTFIIVVTINTIRETRWQDTVKDLQSQMTKAITEIRDGQEADKSQ